MNEDDFTYEAGLRGHRYIRLAQAEAAPVEPAEWQIRHRKGDRWSEWTRVGLGGCATVAERVRDLQGEIAKGRAWELRALYTSSDGGTSVSPPAEQRAERTKEAPAEMSPAEQRAAGESLYAIFEAGRKPKEALDKRESLRDTWRSAERSLSGMMRGEDKHPSPYGEGYVKGWRDCLAIFKALEASWALASSPAVRPSVDALRLFDAAVAEELPHVSTVPYNSHEICDWFAKNVRKRLALSSAPSVSEAGED